MQAVSVQFLILKGIFMTIIFEKDVRSITVRRVAEKMMIAARTAPKAGGVDNLEIAIAEKDDILKIAEVMRSIAANLTEATGAISFLRDADNISVSDGMFLIGTKIRPVGIDKKVLSSICGSCGFATCIEKNKYSNIPCAFNTGDLGIALGSAVSVAAKHHVDNRIMFTVGKAVLQLKLLGDDIKICYAVPLSVSKKNIFYDRKA
jgi:uncharacterized ferredoxin-like protein